MLHNRLLLASKWKTPTVPTPIYFSPSAKPNNLSIQLSRPISIERSENSAQTASGGYIHVKNEGPRVFSPEYQRDNLLSITPTGDLRVTHALLSVNIKTEREMDAKACHEWLAAHPTLSTAASVKGLFKSFDSIYIMIISVPIAFWNLFPEDKAVTLINYVTSSNMVDTTLT